MTHKRTTLKEVDEDMSAMKEEAKNLIDGLPEEATWDDIIYEFYVRKKIEAGLKAEEEGRIVSHGGAKKMLAPQ